MIKAESRLCSALSRASAFVKAIIRQAFALLLFLRGSGATYRNQHNNR